MALPVATKVKACVITSVDVLAPVNLMHVCNAAVPLTVAIAYFEPV